MIDELKMGMRVRWVEDPALIDQSVTKGCNILPDQPALIGPQTGRIIRMQKNKKTGDVKVCVKNEGLSMFHWLHADYACEIMSNAD